MGGITRGSIAQLGNLERHSRYVQQLPQVSPEAALFWSYQALQKCVERQEEGRTDLPGSLLLSIPFSQIAPMAVNVPAVPRC